MLIKWTDYQRIYRVINSVIKNEGADPAYACVYFSAFGSYILSNHYKLDAAPKAGLAAYHFGGEGNVLLFGEVEGDNVIGGGEKFHCWVEVNGWAIDFMAPAFSKLSDASFEIPAKMFQKQLASMSDSMGTMSRAGDFYLASTPFTTAKHMEVLSSQIGYSDLAEICNKWFVKPPKKIRDRIGIGNEKGEMNTVYLEGEALQGTW